MMKPIVAIMVASPGAFGLGRRRRARVRATPLGGGQGIPALKRQVTAAEYRVRALEAAALADATDLDRVREKHECAATRWNELAAIIDEKRERLRARELRVETSEFDPAAGGPSIEDLACTA